MSTQISLLEQVKQGNVNALVTLLNYKFSPKGITAKASVKNSCLHIMLESAKPLPQQSLVDLIQKGLANLNVDVWQTVKVCGRRVGEEVPDWLEELKVGSEATQTLDVLAKQGNARAISSLVNQTLKTQKIIAKVILKDSCLQVMLESTQVPNQQAMVLQLKDTIRRLEIHSVRSMKLYGKQTGEDFPDWHEEVNLTPPAEMVSHGSQVSGFTSHSTTQKAGEITISVPGKEIDRVGLSNQLYTTIRAVYCQHLIYKIDSEADKTIHEIVEHFIDGLESDLTVDLEQFPQQVVNVAQSFGLHIEAAKIQAIVSNVVSSNFTGVRFAIRELEKITHEVLQFDFPQETNALESFFTGAAQEFTANLFGKTTMSAEAIVGAAIGTVIVPGIGSAIGGAIGGWLGGNKQQQAIQTIIEKYQKTRGKFFQEWESLLQEVYESLRSTIHSMYSIQLLTYQVIERSVNYYNEGNNHLKSDEDCRNAISLYNKAIHLNPGLALAWNNKGFALNRLGKYEEALESLDQAIKIDETLVVAFNNWGDALQGLGKNAEAMKAYEQSISLDPVNYPAWVEKGICLYHLRRYEEVLEVCETLISLDSEHFIGWYRKSSCLAIMGSCGKALESLKEAVRLNPDGSQLLAKTDTNFDQLREDGCFKALMESSIGVSYATLEKLLKKKQWKEADQETACLMGSVIEKVTSSREVNQDALSGFPCVDLNTIDKLWRENSDERFGFSVQKAIYQGSSKDRDMFGNKTGWRVRDTNGSYSWRSNTNFDYNFATAPKGHLPSSLWAGEDGWFENRRDRLISLFTRLEASCDLASL